MSRKNTHTPSFFNATASRLEGLSLDQRNPQLLPATIVQHEMTAQALASYNSAGRAEFEHALWPLVGDIEGITANGINNVLTDRLDQAKKMRLKNIAGAVDLERPFDGQTGMGISELLTGVFFNEMVEQIRVAYENTPIVLKRRAVGILGKRLVGGHPDDVAQFTGTINVIDRLNINTINATREPLREEALDAIYEGTTAVAEGDASHIVDTADDDNLVDNLLVELARTQTSSPRSNDNEPVYTFAGVTTDREMRMANYQSSNGDAQPPRRNKRKNASTATVEGPSSEHRPTPTIVELERDENLRIHTPWMGGEDYTTGGDVYLGANVEVHTVDAIAPGVMKDKRRIDAKVRTDGEERPVYDMQIDKVARALAQGISVKDISDAIMFNKNKPNSCKDSNHPYAALKIYLAHQGAKNTARAIYTIRTAEPRHGRDKAYEVILLAVSDRRSQVSLLTSITDMPKAAVSGRTMS